MANPQTKSYDGKISGNILVLGRSGKTTLEEMGKSPMKTYGKGEYVEGDSLIVLLFLKREILPLKFVTRNGGKSYLSRKKLWSTKLVCTISRKSSYSSFCLDKRPHVLWEARCRSQAENPNNQFCYLNSSTSDKLFHTFASRRTDNKDRIGFKAG